MSYSFEHVGLTEGQRKFTFFLLNVLILLPLRPLLTVNWIHTAAIAAFLILIYVLFVRKLPEDSGAAAALPIYLFADLLILLSAVYETIIRLVSPYLPERLLHLMEAGLCSQTLWMLAIGVILLLWGRGQRPFAVTIGQMLLYWAPFVGLIYRNVMDFSAEELRMILFVPLIWRLVCRISEMDTPSVRGRNAWLSLLLGAIFWVFRFSLKPAADQFAAQRSRWIETLTGESWMIALYVVLFLLLAAHSYYFRKKTLGLDGLFVVLMACAAVLVHVVGSQRWPVLYTMRWFALDLGDAAQLLMLMFAAIAFLRQTMQKRSLGVPNSAFLALMTVLLCGAMKLYVKDYLTTLAGFALFIVSLLFLFRARSEEEIEYNPAGGTRTFNWILTMTLLAASTAQFFFEARVRGAATGVVIAGLIVSVCAILVLSWPHPHKRRVSVQLKSLILIGFAIVCVLTVFRAHPVSGRTLEALWNLF